MAIGVVHNESSVGLKVESTAGTYEPSTTGTDYIEVLAEGFELVKTREVLERDNLSSTVEKEKSRVGMAEVTGNIPVEFRASTTAGNAPQMLDIQLRSLLGGKKSEATKTTTTGATSTVLTFTSHSFTVGSSVLVKESGAYEVRPISAVDATTITFPFALDNGAPSDGVVVEAVCTYYHDTANAVSFSAEYNIGNTIQDQARGLTCNSGSLENWTVGTIPTMSFGVIGADIARSDDTQTATPDYTADALPPVCLESCLWIGGNKLAYSELSLNIENEVIPIKDACEASGKTGENRVTGQKVSFTANPYMDDTTFAEFTAWNDNDDTSVFFYAFNPAATAGEFSEVVAVWLPFASFTAIPTGDNEGLATNAIEIDSQRSLGSDSVYISFI
jgi:hypothetical protein